MRSYVDMSGHTVSTRDDTREALLSALGFDVSTEVGVQRELERREAVRRVHVVDTVAVVAANDRKAMRLEVRLPGEAERLSPEYELTVRLESGEEIVSEAAAETRRGSTVWLTLPERLETGYHDIELRITAVGGEYVTRQRRIVHPGRCRDVSAALGEKRAFGIWANLYSVRSERNLGVGDLTDLTRLVDWVNECGGEFVGINPLHSLENRGGAISPYRPTSRLYGNEIYLDVTVIPELQRCEAAKEMLASAEGSGELDALRATSHVDYERVAALKHSVLRKLYDTLRNSENSWSSSRKRQFAEYKRREGKSLVAYATFKALEGHLLEKGKPAQWREWPGELQRPKAPGVAEFRWANETEIDFHCFVQFELDRQLGAVASRASSKMAVGIYGDLALGSDPEGADAWAWQDVLVPGVSIGAPPDDFATEGQDWGLPPLAPEALHDSGYEYWIALLRANLRHAGALRLDHVMGLFRQFWIPESQPASTGTYMKFPAADLLGILALESSRHNAVIVGEDLGTVPRGLPGIMARWGVLSSGVLYFERNRRGAFRPSHAYSKRALVTANTHDLVPIAGHGKGRDLELRRDAGEYREPGAYDDALRHREEDRAELRRRLKMDGLLPDDSEEEDAAALTRAAYTFLARTPAPLVGVSLDDLALEEEPVNLPGISSAGHPSWSRKMSKTIEGLQEDEQVAETVRAVVRERGRG